MTEPTSYTIEELCALAEVTPRTVRNYTAKGLLAAPEFRGSATRYGARYLTELRAIAALKTRGLTLEGIRGVLAVLPDEALRALGAPAHPEPPQAEPALDAERWDRVRLVPGLEVHFRTDCGPLPVRLAREIAAQYAVAPSP